jgi:hypothetical protein
MLGGPHDDSEDSNLYRFEADRAGWFVVDRVG